MRNRLMGSFKNDGWLYEQTGVETYGGTDVPIYDTIPNQFKWRYADGKGLSKEQFDLMQTWRVQSGKTVIETADDDLEFKQGYKVTFDYDDEVNGDKAYRIARIETKVYPNRQLSGNRKLTQSETMLLYLDYD